MMIIIKEAYLRDILVLRFPPSSWLLCHPSPSAGEFVCASALGGSGRRCHRGADRVNPLHTHTHTHTHHFTTETKSAARRRVGAPCHLSIASQRVALFLDT